MVSTLETKRKVLSPWIFNTMLNKRLLNVSNPTVINRLSFSHYVVYYKTMLEENRFKWQIAGNESTTLRSR